MDKIDEIMIASINDLNHIAAEEIMGWHIGDKYRSGWRNKKNTFMFEIESWNPAEDIRETYIVEEELIKRGVQDRYASYLFLHSQKTEYGPL